MRQFGSTFLKKTLIFLVLALGYITPVLSCSTPVFRYALEMWAAYAYRVEVIHDGNLNSSQKQALEYLKNSSSSESPANLMVIETVVNQSANAENEDYPIIKLLYPKEHKISGTIWQGELTEDNAKKIVDSPSRQQALENIQKGDAAVWLFLESGNAERDAKQFKILQDELQVLSENLKLSETATDVAGNLLDIKVINTGVNFSLIKIDRNDPVEEIFIEILLGTEADLKLFNNVPLAFPIFGQGRTLYALAGNGIKHKNIEIACSAIIGWCSCTIKDDNPGTDLLLKADWNIAIGDSSWIQQEEIPDITGVFEFVSLDEDIEEKPTVTVEVEENIVAEVEDTPENIPEKIEVVEILPVENKDILSSTVSVEEQGSFMSPLLRNSLLTIALLMVIITFASFILRRKSQS